MKRSITSKIVLSYLFIIFMSMVFVGLTFSYSARSFFEKQTERILKNDTYKLEEAFYKTNPAENDNSQDYIRQIREDLRRSTIGNLSSDFVLLANDLRIIFPRDPAETAKLRVQVMPALRAKISRSQDFSVKIPYKNTDYIMFIHPVKDQSGKVKGWVMAYAPSAPMRQMSRGLIVVLLASMLVTGVLAVFFGFFVARSIARPIIKLKRRAELLSKRDFDTIVEINTGDELEELANTINRMARELKEYDAAQKKFLQNASHELKTPLMSIQGYAEGLRDGVFEDNDRALDIIVEESARLKSIVDELIFLSKLETMKDFYRFSPESINEIIEKSIEKVKSIALKNNISINARLSRDAVLNVDRDKIIQALINILGNCLRHAGSEISIATANDGKWLEIKVRDDGDGFDGKEIKNVFERFYKGKKGNTGLGMAITKVIIEKHRGTIAAANAENGGAEFTVRLPFY